VTAVLLTVRFLLELTLLVALGIGGWDLADAATTQVVLAVALPLLAAFVWGLLLSPKARVGAPLPARVAIELTLFAVASLLLWAAGLPVFASALLLTELVVVVALIAVGVPPGTDVDLAGRTTPE
jgi:hypothetical protein